MRDAADPTAAVVAAIQGRGDLSETVVRVVVKLRQEQEASLVEREIVRALEGAYFVAALQKDVERTERQRLGAVSVEALTPAQLLERYLQVKDVPEERAKLLLEHGEALIRRWMEEPLMTKLDEYRAALPRLPAADWEPYLLAHSNLPGPRGNLELARPPRIWATRRSSAAGPASARTSRRRTRRGVFWRFAGWWGWAR